MSEEFELLRNITIGQYLPLDSVIHRLDPRFKLTAFILLIGAVTFTATYTGNLVLLAVVMALLVISRIPTGYALSGLKPAMPIIIILALLQLMFYTGSFAGVIGDCRTLWAWWFVNVTTCSLKLVIVSSLRFVELIILTSLLTFSTTITELTHGTESMLRPFQRLGVPAHELALIFTIALRFVPTLAQEMERIMKAQASRGANLGGGSRLQFIQRTRRMLPLLVPLFLDALRRAEELILAMEARCYVGGKGRTRLVQLKSCPADYIALAITLAFVALMLLHNFDAADKLLTMLVSQIVP